LAKLNYAVTKISVYSLLDSKKWTPPPWFHAVNRLETG